MRLVTVGLLVAAFVCLACGRSQEGDGRWVGFSERESCDEPGPLSPSFSRNATLLGGVGEERVVGVVPTSDEIVVAGALQPQPGGDDRHGLRAFVAAVDYSGQPRWFLSIGGDGLTAGDEAVTSIASTGDGQLLLVGYTTSETFLGHTILDGRGWWFLRASDRGRIKVVSVYTGHGAIRPSHVTVGPDGTAFLAGTVEQPGLADSAPQAFIARVSGDGELMWVTRFRSETPPTVQDMAATSTGVAVLLDRWGGDRADGFPQHELKLVDRTGREAGGVPLTGGLRVATSGGKSIVLGTGFLEDRGGTLDPSTRLLAVADDVVTPVAVLPSGSIAADIAQGPLDDVTTLVSRRASGLVLTTFSPAGLEIASVEVKLSQDYSAVPSPVLGVAPDGTEVVALVVKGSCVAGKAVEGPSDILILRLG